MFKFAVYPRGAQPLRGVTSRQAHRALRDAGMSNKDTKAAIGYCIRNQHALLDRPGVSIHLEDVAPAKTIARMEKEATSRMFVCPPGDEARAKQHSCEERVVLLCEQIATREL